MTSCSPKVSIGLPVYNGERHLTAAIESLLAQTFRDFELIISDNGSDDATREICLAYAAADRRIRYYRESVNRGSTWNFNRVFQLASAPYFTWAAHDDVRLPQNLERCVELLDRDASVVLAYVGGFFIDDAGTRLRGFHAAPDLASAVPSERLREWFFAPHLPYRAMFGVIRSDALRRTPLFPNCEADDDILLTNLVVLGRWQQVSGEFLAIREHPRRASASRHGIDLAVWLDPSNKDKPLLPFVRRALLQLDAVRRAPLTGVERARCAWLMLRWAAWRAAQIRQELLRASRIAAVLPSKSR